MSKKIIIIFVLTHIIAIGVGVYGGMKYGQANVPVPARGGGNFSGSGGMRGAGRVNGGGFSSGQIISKDDKSITIKLQDGGSKIVFFSGSTAVMKSASGSAAETENRSFPIASAWEKKARPGAP